MKTTAPIRCLVPYYGAKRTMAPYIITELGQHVSYWEPFCGSMAVLTAKKPAAIENVNDLSGDVTNLAVVIASQRGPELFERLNRTLYFQEIYEQAQRALDATQPVVAESVHHVNHDHLQRAVWYFTASWMGRNGTVGTVGNSKSMSAPYTNGGGSSGGRFKQAVESIPSWHDRLRHVWITRRDAFDLIDKIDDERGTAIYADPPYIAKSTSYLHDFKPDDHARLAQALGRFKKARVVVSYYEHPDLDGLYGGWTRRVVEVPKSMVNVLKKEKRQDVARELLLINGPSWSDQEQMEMFDNEGGVG